MHDADNIEVLKDCVVLRGVRLSIPYPGCALDHLTDLLVMKDTVFDSKAEMSSFGNYEKGDSPYEWIIRCLELKENDINMYLMYGPALSGVFEVSLDGNKIKAYYGSYWWD